MSADSQFIFVRHGQSQANADNVVNSGEAPLTQQGIEQAGETAENLRDLGIEVIICSPLRRARQTAEIIATHLGFERSSIRIVDELRERSFGQLEGMPLDRDPLGYYSEDDDSLGFEPRSLLYERMSHCLEKLVPEVRTQKVLVVGHSISGFFLLQAAAKKASVEEFDVPPKMKNASIIKVTI